MGTSSPSSSAASSSPAPTPSSTPSIPSPFSSPTPSSTPASGQTPSLVIPSVGNDACASCQLSLYAIGIQGLASKCNVATPLGVAYDVSVLMCIMVVIANSV